jgi:pyruvate,water dikinase
MEFVAWFEQLDKNSLSLAGGKGSNLGELVKIKMPVPPGFVITTKAFDKFIELNGIKNQIQELIESCDVDNAEQLLETSKKIKGLILSQDFPIGMRTELIDAYRELSFAEEIITPKAIELIAAGRDYALVAVRSSAQAEDLPSIKENEPVIVKVNGKIIYTEMKDLWRIYEAMKGNGNKFSIQVPSLENNKLKWMPVSEIYRHYVENVKLAKILTRTGRKISITPDHSLIALDAEKLEPKPISVYEVNEDTRIPVIKYLPLTKTKREKFLDVSKVLNSLPLSIEKNRVKLADSKNWKISNSFPLKILVDENFAYFLGIYAAEGSTYNNNYVDISCESKVIAKKVKKYLSSLGLKCGKNKENVRIFNKVLVAILHELFGKPLSIKGKGKSARVTKVPDIIFNQDKKIISAFLRGCFDGDGYVSNTTVGFTSVSKNLLGGMAKLLEIIGIRFYFSKGNSIMIFQSELSKFNKLIGFTEKKNRKKLKEAINSYKENKKHYDFFNGDVIWDKIKKIEFEDYSGHVYDFVVPKTQNFAAGLGGIITHNTASFAGQQATFLNVKGVKDYLESVKKCWASLYEPRAIFYRAKQGIKHSSIAVVVQRMVSSDASGVMFTINPTTGENEIVIEATWGLGESLVAGEVEPDFYRVSKDGRILEKKIGKKEKMRVRDLATDRTVVLPVAEKKVNAQVLSDEEILKLADYGIAIEKHYGKPQDIEFAIERGRIFIVQTRAVTTQAKIEKVKVEGEILLKGLGASPGIASGVVRIVHGLQDIAKVQKGDILVTKMTSPDLVPTMSKCAAIITDAGGRTCHAAIVSREMGIPCIVGTQTATQVLKDGQEVTVDAYSGTVYSGRIEIKKPEVEVSVREELPALEKLTATQIKVNLAFADNLEQIVPKVDGVGLLRIEHMITKAGIHPAKLIKEGRKEDYVKILLEGIRPIAKAFHPKPVWVRTLDARSDEFRNLEGGEEEPKEDNPMLGWHGIRRSLDEPELLKAEFEAIKRLHEEGLNNVHVMLPFVISVDELRKAREIAKEVGLPAGCKLGLMVETPAAALTIEDFCKEGIDFISFGTNDLSQLVLGVDRNNEKLAKLFTETHSGVKKLVKYVIKVCKSYNVETSICGEAPSNIPEFVEFLVKAGIDSISVNVDAIDRVKMQVVKIERKLLLEALRKGKEKSF